MREFPRHPRHRERYAWRSDALFLATEAVPASRMAHGSILKLNVLYVTARSLAQR